MQAPAIRFFTLRKNMKTQGLNIFPVSAAIPTLGMDRRACRPMGTRKTRFEVVPLAAIAALVGNTQLPGATPATRVKTVTGRILSVAYDRSLAATREMLFSSIGLHVASALTMENAIGLCQSESLDLIVVGHSIPIDHRQELVKELRRHCDAPVLALYRPGEPRLVEANYVFDSTQSPAALLEAVSGILKSKTHSAEINVSVS